MRRVVESSSLKESAVRNHAPVDRVTAGAGQRRLVRATLAAVALATASAAGLSFGAASASAALPAWGYEQITPAGGSSLDIYGNLVSPDGSTVLAMIMGSAMAGMPSDGRGLQYNYGFPRGGAPWTVGPVDPANGARPLNGYLWAMTGDGSRVITAATVPSVDGAPAGVYRFDAQGEAANMASGNAIPVFDADAGLDALAYLSPPSVYVGRPGHAPVQVSVDNAGNPMGATQLGGSDGTGVTHTFLENAFAADGSSVIFTSPDGIPGDNDGGMGDVYRRILTPGQEETYAITDANGIGDVDGAFEAQYRWATPDHSRVFFVTDEALEPGDTDGQQDVYLRDGKSAPVRVSQGETVDGEPSGNGSIADSYGRRPEWAMSSQDGNRTFFVTGERLTQDAPTAGVKLYERDVAEGRTRLVAGPLDLQDVGDGSSAGVPSGSLIGRFLRDLHFRGLRVTPDGAVFMSSAPLAGSTGPERKVFAWSRDGGLEQVGKPDADAPPSAVGWTTFLAYPAYQSGGDFDRNPYKAGRGVSDDGSQVFFSTSQSLTAQDTDGGYRDVYAWSKADGVRLVSPPGSDPHPAHYLDSSADGSQVWFQTSASVLPSDTDPSANDVYVAVLGGGSPPRPQVPDADRQPCAGDACQGSAPDVVAPIAGSVSFVGSGNVLTGPSSIVPAVAVSKVKAVTGTAVTLKVRVPAAGEISVSGASLRRAERSASMAGSYSVKVALSAGGKRTLKRKKSLKVPVRVAYRSGAGQSASKSVSVTFKQPQTKKSFASKKGGR